MTMLKDAIKSKGGSFFMMGDIVGKDVTITEDMTPDSDIRQTEDEKYFCLQIKLEGEVKDLHLPSGALRALYEAMPGGKTWKGESFQVTAITGKGYKTKTHISYVQKGVDARPEAQKRIETPSTTPTSPNNIPVDPHAHAVAVCLEALKGASTGVHDSMLDEFIRNTLLQRNIVESVSFVAHAVRYGGRAKVKDGVWTVIQ